MSIEKELAENFKTKLSDSTGNVMLETLKLLFFKETEAAGGSDAGAIRIEGDSVTIKEDMIPRVKKIINEDKRKLGKNVSFSQRLILNLYEEEDEENWKPIRDDNAFGGLGEDLLSDIIDGDNSLTSYNKGLFSACFLDLLEEEEKEKGDSDPVTAAINFIFGDDFKLICDKYFPLIFKDFNKNSPHWDDVVTMTRMSNNTGFMFKIGSRKMTFNEYFELCIDLKETKPDVTNYMNDIRVSSILDTPGKKLMFGKENKFSVVNTIEDIVGIYASEAQADLAPVSQDNIDLDKVDGVYIKENQETAFPFKNYCTIETSQGPASDTSKKINFLIDPFGEIVFGGPQKSGWPKNIMNKWQPTAFSLSAVRDPSKNSISPLQRALSVLIVSKIIKTFDSEAWVSFIKDRTEAKTFYKIDKESKIETTVSKSINELAQETDAATSGNAGSVIYNTFINIMKDTVTSKDAANIVVDSWESIVNSIKNSRSDVVKNIETAAESIGISLQNMGVDKHLIAAYDLCRAYLKTSEGNPNQAFSILRSNSNIKADSTQEKAYVQYMLTQHSLNESVSYKVGKKVLSESKVRNIVKNYLLLKENTDYNKPEGIIVELKGLKDSDDEALKQYWIDLEGARRQVSGAFNKYVKENGVTVKGNDRLKNRSNDNFPEKYKTQFKVAMKNETEKIQAAKEARQKLADNIASGQSKPKWDDWFKDSYDEAKKDEGVKKYLEWLKSEESGKANTYSQLNIDTLTEEQLDSLKQEFTDFGNEYLKTAEAQEQFGYTWSEPEEETISDAGVSSSTGETTASEPAEPESIIRNANERKAEVIYGKVGTFIRGSIRIGTSYRVDSQKQEEEEEAVKKEARVRRAIRSLLLKEEKKTEDKIDKEEAISGALDIMMNPQGDAQQNTAQQGTNNQKTNDTKSTTNSLQANDSSPSIKAMSQEEEAVLNILQAPEYLGNSVWAIFCTFEKPNDPLYAICIEDAEGTKIKNLVGMSFTRAGIRVGATSHGELGQIAELREYGGTALEFAVEKLVLHGIKANDVVSNTDLRSLKEEFRTDASGEFVDMNYTRLGKLFQRSDFTSDGYRAAMDIVKKYQVNKELASNILMIDTDAKGRFKEASDRQSIVGYARQNKRDAYIDCIDAFHGAFEGSADVRPQAGEIIEMQIVQKNNTIKLKTDNSKYKSSFKKQTFISTIEGAIAGLFSTNKFRRVTDAGENKGIFKSNKKSILPNTVAKYQAGLSSNLADNFNIGDVKKQDLNKKILPRLTYEQYFTVLALYHSEGGKRKDWKSDTKNAKTMWRKYQAEYDKLINAKRNQIRRSANPNDLTQFNKEVRDVDEAKYGELASSKFFDVNTTDIEEDGKVTGKKFSSETTGKRKIRSSRRSERAATSGLDQGRVMTLTYIHKPGVGVNRPYEDFIMPLILSCTTGNSAAEKETNDPVDVFNEHAQKLLQRHELLYEIYRKRKKEESIKKKIKRNVISRLISEKYLSGSTMIGRGSFGSRIKRSPSKKTEKEDKSNEEEAQFKAVEKSQQEKLIIKKIEVKDGPTDNGKDTCTITITTNRGVVEEEEFEAFTDIIGSKAVTEYGKSVPDSTKGKLGGDSKPVNGIDLKGAIINNKTVIRTNNSGIIEEIDKHNTETIVYLIPPIVTYSDNKNRNRTISIKGSINKKNDTTFEIFINSSTHSNNAQATQDNATVQENLNGSPLEEKKINSPPHVARRIEAKKDKEPKPHGGVDFKAKTGDKIYAVKAGKVHKIEYSTAPTGYGTQIVIKHDDGTFSRYAHMNGLVSKDDSVTMVSSENESYDVSTEIKEGQLIGFVGMTGFATGPHLHFEYYTKENATYMERAISTIDWLIENEGRGYTIVKNEEWEAIKKWRASGLGVEYAPVTGDESTNPGLNDYEVGKSKYKVNEDSSGNVTSVEYETVERELIGVDHYTDSPGFFLRYTEETGLNEKILFSVQKGSNDIIEKVIVMIPKNGLTLPDPNSMKFVEKKDGKIVVSGKVADYQNDPNYLIFDVDLGPESNVNKETVLTMTTESYFESNDGNTYSDYNFIFENKD